jgi:hypothetical protein
MPRIMIDCRAVPSESGCTLAISGERDEVLRAAVAHAVDVHGHQDDPELRAAIESGLREAAELPTPGSFVQLIEFSTRRIDEFEQTVARWTASIGGARTARWAMTGADRDQPDRFLQLVAFPDYAAAMANSDHPATGEFAGQLRKLCDGDATFHNLDVRSVTTF